MTSARFIAASVLTMYQGDDIPDFGDNVDREVFDQILEMDEDDEREFSSGIVLGFLDQAESTFKSMDVALYASQSHHAAGVLNRKYRKARNLTELSHLGHFLKGSSATLGFNKVKDECEKIQRKSTGLTLHATLLADCVPI